MAYRRWALAVMTLVVVFNYIDRGLITILLQPIKVDLQLTDTQLGFLTGIAFGLFYATLGLPIARWADRGNRVTITSLAIGLWAITVTVSFFVRSFLQLLIARVAAGVGEAGCIPPTYSLVGDYFPGASERTRAMSVYMLAPAFAALISFAVGGWVNDHYGWRVAFLAMGLPGLAVALLVKLSVTEPPRPTQSLRSPTVTHPSMTDVFKLLWRRRSARHLTLGIILFYVMGLGLLPWYAAFLIRSHAMSTVEVGIWMGLVCGGGGVAGILLGGYAAVRWFTNNERSQMRFAAVLVAALVPCFALFLLLPNKYEALLAFVPLVMLFNSYSGPIYSLLQRLVADNMRATTLAVVMFLANLIGMGIGPQLVGTLSDVMAPSFGDNSLRYAMLALSFTALWAAYHFWQAGRSVTADLSAAEA